MLDVKTELENYWYYVKAISCLNDELLHLEKMAAFPLSDEIAAKYEELIKDVKTDIARYLELIENVEMTISGIPNERERAILWLKYVEGMTWKEVAETVECDYTNVQKIAAKVISRLTIKGVTKGHDTKTTQIRGRIFN